MDRHHVILLLSLATLTVATGCSSLIGNGIGLATTSASPYIGLRGDVDEISESLHGPPTVAKAVNGIVFAIDAPFSAALDTLLLPVVIPQHLKNREWASRRKPPVDTVLEAHEREIMRLHQEHLKSTIENGTPPVLVDGVPQAPQKTSETDQRSVD